MRLSVFVCAAFVCFGSTVASAQFESGWKAHDMNRPAPTVVTPSDQVNGAPSDAIVLFDGSDMSQWKGKNGDPGWKIVDGAMESVPNSGFVTSREEFGDCQVHLEFATPSKVEGNSQGRGNSGIYFMGEFEIQILDSFENKTYADGSAGSVYGQYPPLVNASRGPGQWQSYDIVFRRPRFDDDGKLNSPAKFTVFHNGVVIQDASESYGPTNWILHKTYESMKDKTKGPIGLQDHGNPVRFRNIWARHLPESRERPAAAYETQTAKFKLEAETIEKLVGKYEEYSVKQANGNLIFVFNQTAPLEMVPLSATKFGFTKSAGSITFEMDDSGMPVGFELKLDATGTRQAKRSGE